MPITPGPPQAAALSRVRRHGRMAVLAPLLLVIAATSAGGRTAGEVGPAGALVQDPDYAIGVGDRLELTVRGEPSLSGPVIVRPDGAITLPLAGDVPAAGRTVAELAEALTAALAAVIVEPAVTVRVLDAVGHLPDQVRIVGSGVDRPRAVPFRRGMTLVDALEASSGADAAATPAHGGVVTLRRRDGRELTLDGLADGVATPLEPGDVVVLREAGWRGRLVAATSLDLSLGYTDNVALRPADRKQDALILAVRPGMALSSVAPRLALDLDAGLLARQTMLADAGAELVPELALTATAELAERLLFVDAAAGIEERADSGGDATSVVEANGRNRDSVRAFSISPYLVNRFGRDAVSLLRYTAGYSSSSAGSLSDAVVQEVAYSLSSGPAFTRLGWRAIGRAQWTNRSGTADADRRDARLALDYAVTPGFVLEGSVGYEDFDDGIDRFSGPTWRAGVRLEPDRRTAVAASYGRENDSRSALVRASWRPAARLELSAGYQETVESAQFRLIRTIGSVPPAEAPVGEPLFRLVDQATRLEVYSAGLSWSDGRLSLDVTGAREIERSLSGGAVDESRWVAAVGLRHALSAATGVGLTLAHEDEKGDRRGAGDNRTWRVGLGLDHRIDDGLTARIAYGWQRRVSDVVDRGFSENGVTLGLRMVF